MHKFLPGVLIGLAASGSAAADVVTASPDHYVLMQSADSTMSAEDLWDRLLSPEDWWHPDHTYSGEATNLSLNADAGGLWREDWDDGSVVHGQVLAVGPGYRLRLNAPFGPLQDLAVTVVWTITIAPAGDGSRVTFHEVANGTNASKLDELAPAVDFVKSQAITRLVGGPEQDN